MQMSDFGSIKRLLKMQSPKGWISYEYMYKFSPIIKKKWHDCSIFGKYFVELCGHGSHHHEGGILRFLCSKASPAGARKERWSNTLEFTRKIPADIYSQIHFDRRQTLTEKRNHISQRVSNPYTHRCKICSSVCTNIQRVLSIGCFCNVEKEHWTNAASIFESVSHHCSL